MKNFLFFTIVVILIGGAAFAAPLPSAITKGSYINDLSREQAFEQEQGRTYQFTEKAVWKRGDIEASYVKLNALRFSNRARCAADSQKPTRSFYVLIDSLNVAKGAYRLALATGQDRNIISRQAVERFRYSVLKLINYISQKMIKGELPLLSSDNRAGQGQDLYRRITESCRLDGYCPELDEYLTKLWNYPRGKDKVQLNWNDVDNFLETDFIDQKLLNVENKIPALACYYLKKHSPLQGQLDSVVPDKIGLTLMAQAMIDQKQLLASCDDIDAQKSIEFASYQIDLNNFNSQIWENQGFDFFHSLKIYFSWAWRFAPEISSFTYPFHNYFKSVHLEDSVMFFSNGCESLTKPVCDTTFINEQSLRNFAQQEYARNDSAFDNLLYLPEGASQEMVNNHTPEVNSDVLDLNKFQTMDDWMKNFRENIRKSRGLVKGRLLRSMTTMDLVLKNLKHSQILASLDDLKNDDKPLPYSVGDREIHNFKRQQMYALCAETFIASDEILSFLRKKLTLLNDIKTLDPLFDHFSDFDLKNFYDYYDGLFKDVRIYCKALESEKYWGDDFVMDKTLFSSWYKEAIYKNSVPPAVSEHINTVGTPLLAYNFFSTTQNFEQVICWDGIDCSRKILESIINLYSVAQYQELYFPKEQNIQTPDLANPYAERVACKVYDPWWQTKRAFFHVISNTTAAAASIVNPTPFFLSVDVAPKTVVSFNTLVENGTLKLEPQYDSKRVLTTMGADLGKWLGVPCTVAISNQISTSVPSRTYFTGLTIEACRANTTTGAVVNNASDIEKNPDQTISGCVSCSLNFARILENGNSLPIPIPVVQSSFYLLRGAILFFKEMRDPVNVPHRYEVNPNYVLETFRRYGEIPKNCVNRLINGKHCLENYCEQAIATLFQEEWGSSIKGIDLHVDKAQVKISQCENDIQVKNIRHYLNLFCKKELDKSQVDLGDCEPKKKAINYEIR